MYDLIKKFFLPILKVEDKHPAPLPGHAEGEAVQIFRASPAYLSYRLFYWKLGVGATVMAIIIAGIALTALSGWFILLAVLALVIGSFKAALFYVAIRLDYEMRWYVVTERSLLIREGAWVVREICLTFANAQNVRVKQGPLQRWFGFSNVEIDTAGGSGQGEQKGAKTHRAVLSGLDNPAPVRDRILDLLRHHRTTGLGDPDDALSETAGLPVLWEIREETQQLRTVLTGRLQP